eukprot:5289153-Pyramimonas_sp.AAC.1
MHRSPTDITAGVSGMTNASKFPSLKLRHATQTEPRALEEPPAVFRVLASSLPVVLYHTHCTCSPNETLSSKIVSTARVDYEPKRSE